MYYEEAEKFTLINNIQESVEHAGSYFNVISPEWERRLENVMDRCHKEDYKELTNDILWLNQMGQEISYQTMRAQKEYGKLLTLIEYPKDKKSGSNTIIK